MRQPATARHEPLTATVFHVLFALAEGPLHGYAVMRSVEKESGIAMGPGTVYGSLARLGDLGWVADAGEATEDARRGRLFRITAPGRSALASEVERMTRLTALARRRGLQPGRIR